MRENSSISMGDEHTQGRTLTYCTLQEWPVVVSHGEVYGRAQGERGEEQSRIGGLFDLGLRL